jgi:uroporphyrin-III C-methyltransferase
MSAEIESLSTDVHSRRPGRGVSPMLVALAVLGLLLALYANWRIGRYDTRYERLRGQIAELRTTQDKLDGRLQWLTADLESSRTTWRNELRGLREVPAQVEELARSIEELRARTEAPQRAWVRAEALYLLELAERRIALERDVQTAIVAMESADGRLATLDDPALREVRARLDTEMAGLRAVQRPDLPEILTRVGRLEDAVPTLPVIGMPVSEVRRTRPEVEEDGALARAWRRIGQATRDLVSLRRIEPATSRLVTQEEDALRRQHLELLLFSARIAAMRPDATAFSQSLRAAGAWIEQYFDTARPEVARALAEIAALAELNVDPELPRVGEAASLLRSVIRASAPTPSAPTP